MVKGKILTYDLLKKQSHLKLRISSQNDCTSHDIVRVTLKFFNFLIEFIKPKK